MFVAKNANTLIFVYAMYKIDMKIHILKLHNKCILPHINK